MRLFNTQTQQKEPFQPVGNEVTIYVCAMMPHDATCLSHAFTHCAADVLVRYLEMKGWPVKHGHNLADTDDVVGGEAKAKAEDQQPLGNRWPGHFIEDVQSLNVRPPDCIFRFTSECSGKAAQNLGQTIDIQIADSLIRNHQRGLGHAQSMSTQKPFVRFWLQTAPVEHETQEMGESPHNSTTIRDLLKRFSPDVLRIYLAQHHYRQPWSHDELALEKAARSAEKLIAAMAAVSTGDQAINVAPAQNRFAAAMDNDLDTVKGIATLLNLADEIVFRAPNAYLIDEAQAVLRRMASVFGVRLDREEAEKRVINGWNEHRHRFEERSN